MCAAGASQAAAGQGNVAATALGHRRLLAAIGLTGSAAILTVALGVATTKVIAIVAGPAGVAVMGLYRYFGALMSRSLLLGLDTTLVQRISTTKDPKAVSNAVGGALIALVLQGALIAAIGFAAAEPIATWLFGSSPADVRLVEIRVVLAMAYANLILQVMTAVLNGRAEVRKVAWLGVVAAVVTLVVIYPLLRLGNLGLAINVGSGSTVAAALATFYVWRVYRSSWVGAPFGDRWRSLVSGLARSGFLILHPVVMMSAMVGVQALILGRYTIDGLGAYNAAMAVLDTALMVMMASARSFFFPSLGKLDEHEDKAGAVNRALRINLVIATSITLVAIAGAPIVIPLLFSGGFERAIAILPPFSLALVGQALLWSYAMFYLHHARYGLFFMLDLLWAAAYVGGTALVVTRAGSLEAAAWIYAGSYLLSGIVYTGVAVQAYGSGMLERRNLLLAALAVSGSLGACWLRELGLWQLDVAIACVGLTWLAWVARRTFTTDADGDVG